MLKLISVFDATGNQGGSVIKYILEDPLLSKEYKIRGLTSDTSKGPAQNLAQKGVEVVSADLNCVDSLTTALEGSHTIFLVTESLGVSNVELEFSQGKNVTIVARNLDVSYIIFSSLHVEDATEDNLRSFPHFDSKANIEKYIRGSGLKCTFILPGHFMSNFTQMLKKAEGGKYQLCCPVDGKKAKFPLFDATDTGTAFEALRCAR
ncbi:hypothetical protein LTR66_017799 [Elasticomyces elasticus]|nr:hypothetical protein LTR66_017799 [Elasticomyces elasticus]